MYLSEQFLDKVGSDFSMESIRQAVRICSREFLNRYREMDWERDARALFFYEENGEVRPTAQFWELMDFWEVFREFSSLFAGEKGEEMELLHTVRKIDQMYHCLLNGSIVKRLGEEGRNRLLELCRDMEKAGEDRTVRIFFRGSRGMGLVYEMQEDREKERQIGQLALQNRLAEAMETGGNGAGISRRREGKPGSEAGGSRESALRECERICFKEGRLESLQRRRAFADAGRVFRRGLDGQISGGAEGAVALKAKLAERK